MKLIIAGSRTLTVSNVFIEGILKTIPSKKDTKFFDTIYMTVKEIVSGTAKGIDKCGENFATCDIMQPKITRFPADWEKHGKSAGYIRNKEMADYADALLLIWDGESKGSANMKDIMLKMNKPVYEVIIKQHNT